jgi:hypothetical protein
LQAAETESGSVPAVNQRVRLKWLGNGGWEIRFGEITVLIDPFLTRREASRSAEWKTDEQAVLQVIRGANYIFAGHSWPTLITKGDHLLEYLPGKFGGRNSDTLIFIFQMVS